MVYAASIGIVSARGDKAVSTPMSARESKAVSTSISASVRHIDHCCLSPTALGSEVERASMGVLAHGETALDQQG